MSWYKRRFVSLRSKFITLFVLFITIPFLISGIITYQKYSANVEANARSYTAQIMDQIVVNLDRYVKEMERLTLTPLYDEEVLNILRNHSGLYQRPQYLTTDETNKMNLFISSLRFDRSEIHSILIFANDGSLFSSFETTVGTHWTKESTPWMDRVRERDGRLTIVPPHEATYYKEPLHQVVSLARVIREPYTHLAIGVVKVDLTSKSFDTILSSVSFSDNSELHILDQDGNVLYSKSQSQEPLNHAQVVRNDRDYLYAEVESDYTGIKATGIVPLTDLRKEARELTSFTLIISLIALALAYLMAVVSSNRLVRPIQHLQSKMKLVQMGAFQERAVVTTNDEIGQLTYGFNQMIEHIDYLVKEVYERTLREREAELSALQGQINPHFLYNTLETMNMLAVEKDNHELSGMITSLGKLLHYTVDKKEKPVHLKDEILFVESYLKIQSFRLGDKLCADIRVDPSFEICLVPKLILQPLIENVIEHGLKSRERVNLELKVRAEEDNLIISIQDDGVGMTLEQIEQLEELMNRPRHFDMPAESDAREFGKVKKGYALRNVHQRLRLLYGEDYGLYIDRSVNQGSRFWIKLPINLGG